MNLDVREEEVSDAWSRPVPSAPGPSEVDPIRSRPSSSLPRCPQPLNSSSPETCGETAADECCDYARLGSRAHIGRSPLYLLSPSAVEDFPPPSPPFDSVVVGLAPQAFEYTKLNEAFRLLAGEEGGHEKGTVRLIVTHKARYFGDTDGKNSLGPGEKRAGLLGDSNVVLTALDRSQDRSLQLWRKRQAVLRKSVRLLLILTRSVCNR